MVNLLGMERRGHAASATDAIVACRRPPLIAAIAIINAPTALLITACDGTMFRRLFFVSDRRRMIVKSALEPRTPQERSGLVKGLRAIVEY